MPSLFLRGHLIDIPWLYSLAFDLMYFTGYKPRPRVSSGRAHKRCIRPPPLSALCKCAAWVDSFSCNNRHGPRRTAAFCLKWVSIGLTERSWGQGGPIDGDAWTGLCFRRSCGIRKRRRSRGG
ncbi:unnamed protein product [Hapterophycus canaliculatus]